MTERMPLGTGLLPPVSPLRVDPLAGAVIPCAARPKPLRLYEVTVRMYGQTYSHPVSARSPAAAKYRAYLDADLSGSFRDYQRACSVRLYPGQPADDGYGYIRRAYGVDVRVGQRVMLKGEGPEWDGLVGEVVYPGTSRQYVHVAFEGLTDVALVHPNSIVSPPVSPFGDHQLAPRTTVEI